MHDVAALLRAEEGACNCDQLAVDALARIEKLDDVGVRAGDVGASRVAVGAVVELKSSAVGVGAVQANLVPVGRFVAREDDLTVGKHGRREIMIGVEANLMDAAAVGIHDVQQKDWLLPVIGLRRVLGPALVDQNGFSRRLPSG